MGRGEGISFVRKVISQVPYTFQLGYSAKLSVCLPVFKFHYFLKTMLCLETLQGPLEAIILVAQTLKSSFIPVTLPTGTILE